MSKYALVCPPSDSLANALRMNDLGNVNVPKAKKQHRDYCMALQSFGYTLIAMPPEKALPDSTFVEDPAININNELLVIARLKDPKRQGEEARMRDILSPLLKRQMLFSEMTTSGFVEGGDVLPAMGTLYIGISKRTDVEGAEQLARIAHNRAGWKSAFIEIPSSYLHLKGEATFHENSVYGPLITVSEEIADHFTRSGCKLIVTPKEERFAGNCISHESRIIVHRGSHKTVQILKRHKFEPRELDLSEFAKIDGAMTCLSKLFIL